MRGRGADLSAKKLFHHADGALLIVPAPEGKGFEPVAQVDPARLGIDLGQGHDPSAIRPAQHLRQFVERRVVHGVGVHAHGPQPALLGREGPELLRDPAKPVAVELV